MIAISVRYTIITYKVGKNVVRYERESGTRQYYSKIWRDFHLCFRGSSCRQRHTCFVKGGRVDQATGEWWKWEVMSNNAACFRYVTAKSGETQALSGRWSRLVNCEILIIRRVLDTSRQSTAELELHTISTYNAAGQTIFVREDTFLCQAFMIVCVQQCAAIEGHGRDALEIGCCCRAIAWGAAKSSAVVHSAAYVV